MKRAGAAALLLALAASAALRADGELQQHWLLRSRAQGIREPSGTRLAPNPAQPAQPLVLPLAEHDFDGSASGSLRRYGAWDLARPLRLEWNLLLDATGGSASLSPSAQPLGRSAVLERRIYADQRSQVDADIDQLNLRWQGSRLAVVAGRQSINLGQNFFFSPLDLFQPFQPQDNYRDFRPGVDALRGTLSTGTFTQIEAIAVAGYAPRVQGGNAVQDDLRLDGPAGQASALLRALSGGEAWAVSALGGRFADSAVGGASLQLEGLGSSWTLEAGYRQALNPPLDVDQHQDQATLGWARQWNAWLNSRIEFSQQNAVSGPTGGTRNLAAINASMQASPLWTLAPTLLWYGDAGQGVALFDAAWSASENSTLDLLLSLPVLLSTPGGPQDAPSLTQTLPATFSVDFRWVI